MEVIEGGVGRRGAVCPTFIAEVLARATAGAARDMAVVESGMVAVCVCA